MKIKNSELETIIQETIQGGGDFADVFIEETVKNKIELSDDHVKNVSTQFLSGMGLRVIADKKEYYGYTNDISGEGLKKLSEDIQQIVQGLNGNVNHENKNSQGNVMLTHPIQRLPHEVSWDEKLNIVKQVNENAREVSSQIDQVTIGYLDEVQNVRIFNSEGLDKEDRRIRSRLTVGVVASDGQNKQMGYESPGAHQGFEFFESLDLKELPKKTAEQALRMLKAKYAPQGKMPVIIDSGFGGVIFHEACGHSLEASAIAKNASVFTGKLNEQIASQYVSAIDDGTLVSEWGSTHIDDEGSPTSRNLLIENGILKSYLVDRLNGSRLGIESTGSARRESYKYAPTSRMNNTFILPGQSSLEEMISNTEYGLYASKLGGGSVNPTTGEFNFAVTEGYIIKNGKLAEAVKGAVLIGRGDEVLKNIDMVGKDLKLAQGICGASSGWVPVNVGQPPIRVQDILVGGQ